MTLTTPPSAAPATFLWSEPDWDMRLERADIAFLGIPYGSGYSFAEQAPDCIHAPSAMRAATPRILFALERHDFDLGGPIYAGLPIRAVDCGDVRADVTAPRSHIDRAEQAVRRIRAAGALPIILGGDHGIPIPVFRAYDDDEIVLIQIDQHLDWRDELNGVRDGLSSPMRRASEMPHVKAMFQIGLRNTGSARPQEVEAALAYGAQLVTADELREGGVDAILAKIPDGKRYYVTIDMDGLDPSCAPGVGSLGPGGVTYRQARALLRGLVSKGRVVGMDIVEITPRTDVNQITCITAGRLIVNLLGAAARAGHFKGGDK